METTTRYFWTTTIRKVNEVLAKQGFTVMPTCNGVMCLIDEEQAHLGCPEILARFKCSQLADVHTILFHAKLAINRLLCQYLVKGFK